MCAVHALCCGTLKSAAWDRDTDFREHAWSAATTANMLGLANNSSCT